MSGQSAATLRKESAASPPIKRVLSWGRYPKIAHYRVHRPAWNDQVPEIVGEIRDISPVPPEPIQFLRFEEAIMAVITLQKTCQMG